MGFNSAFKGLKKKEGKDKKINTFI
jgi:hypothetical protein